MKSFRDIRTLKLWDKNPRGIKDVDFARLKRQIARLGQFKPLIIDENDIVIGGNMRYRAFMDMNIYDVWVEKVDTSGDDSRRLEIALADNDEAGFYEEDRLAELIANSKNISLKDYKVSLNGETVSLKTVLDRYSPIVIAPEESVPLETVIRLGDLILLGPHRLVCGDFRDAGVITRLTTDERLNAAICSPPYSIAITDPPYNLGKQYDTITDKLSPEEFVGFIDSMLATLLRITRRFVVFPGLLNLKTYLTNSLLPVHIGCWLSRNKQSRSKLHGMSRWEPLLYYGFYDVIIPEDFYDVTTERIDHLKELFPVPKPIKLMQELVVDLTTVGDTVIDLFGGSGSTLLACESLQRICYMTEISPLYCQLIVNRYEQLTEKKCTILNS